MEATILHFSDLHLDDSDCHVVVEQLSEPIRRATRSAVAGSSAVVLVFSGDIANKGTNAEYNSASHLLDRIAAVIVEEVGQDGFAEVFVPGNHDCDLSLSDSLRDLILASPDASKDVDAIKISKCLEVQAPYREFVDARQQSNAHPVHAVKDLLAQEVLYLNGISIGITLLNTAWVSRRGEAQGDVVFPSTTSLAAAPDCDAKIAVMHHPYAWINQAARNSLLRSIEETSSLVLTGHEHVPDGYSKSRHPARNIYIEAPPLWDRLGDEPSAFTVIRLDLTAQTATIRRATNNGKGFITDTLHSDIDFCNPGGSLTKTHDFTGQFYTTLLTIGYGLTHPSREDITLSDVFIYPTLRELDRDDSEASDRIIAGDKALETIAGRQQVLITGDEKSGKSSLAKMLTLDLQRRHFFPITLLDDEPLPSKDMMLRRLIDRRAKCMYGIDADSYLGNEKGHRVLIVDDYDLRKCGGSSDAFFEAANRLFGKIIIFGSSQLELAQLFRDPEAAMALWAFSHFEIQDLGYRDRCRLVQKWVEADPAHRDTAIDLTTICTRKETVLTIMLGKNLLPRVPLFALIILRQLDTAADLDGDQANLGRVYELIISSALLGAHTSRISSEEMANYLTQLARHLFDRSITSISRSDLEAWTGTYRLEWNSSFSFGEILDALAHAGILKEVNDYVVFHYVYMYQYFVAKGIAADLDEGHEGIDCLVTDLSKRLYSRDVANIMIFLCYLSRHPVIIDSIVDRANGVFDEDAEFNLGEDASVLTSIQASLPKLPLLNMPLDQAREKILAAADKADREGIQRKRRESDTKMSVVISDLNASYRVIQIAGQILRNYQGKLRGAKQEELMKACFGAGLRTLSALIRIGEEESEEVTQDYVEHLLGENPDLAKHEIIQEVSNKLSAAVLRAVFNVIKHLSYSTGSKRLSVTLDQVVKKEDNVSYPVIGCSTKMDHYDVFPEGEVERVWKKSKGYLAKNTIRGLVWYDFHIFERDIKTVQRMCSLLDIQLPPNRFLDPRIKVKRKKLR